MIDVAEMYFQLIVEVTYALFSYGIFLRMIHLSI